MKSLLLVRHAKSSWNFDVEDFDRPLNERGQNDAPKMAERLFNRNIKIEQFVTSPAKRAITTAGLFAQKWQVSKTDLIVVPYLYEPSVGSFIQAIKSFNNGANTVALFSHNPAITDFANTLTTTKIDDMPTCAVFAVEAEIEKWVDFESATKNFLFFEYPKLR